MDVFDCIYLPMELQYLDVAETLVEEWKSGVVDWTDAERKKLIQFYDYLGKNNENAIQYKALLDTAIASRKCLVTYTKRLLRRRSVAGIPVRLS